MAIIKLEDDRLKEQIKEFKIKNTTI